MRRQASMPTKKRSLKKPNPKPLANLTETEQDLLWHLEHGYQLETDSLGSDPVLRRLTDNETVRPASVNRTTVEALAERGLITQAKSRVPLKVVWRARAISR